LKNANKHYLNQELIDTNIIRKLIVFLFLIYSSVGYCAQVEDILAPIKVSKSNISTWATPIAYRDGQVFIVTVEQPDNVSTGINLKTVIRKGEKSSEGWKWGSFVVDTETIDDQWHNVPSLAIDAKGYIHVAYNMHNMPWQYSVSTNPLDIKEFEFKGEIVKTLDKLALKQFKRTPFPGIGESAIPGNQITYPAFFYDKKDDLYITYRFAVRPRQSFKNRGLAAGIAKYDLEKRTWTALGGEFVIGSEDVLLKKGNSATVTPFAVSFGWTAYLPRLAFDSGNRMHIAWMWRKGGPGSDHSHPSYAWSADGGKTFFSLIGNQYKLPITIETADKVNLFNPNTKFYGPTRLLLDPNDTPYLLLQPIGKTRVMTRFDKNKMTWSDPETMPSSALDFEFDAKGNLWAFANGLKIYKRSQLTNSWQLVFEDRDAKSKNKAKKWCQPKVLSVPEKSMFLVHSQSCDFERIKITSVRWD